MNWRHFETANVLIAKPRLTSRHLSCKLSSEKRTLNLKSKCQMFWENPYVSGLALLQWISSSSFFSRSFSFTQRGHFSAEAARKTLFVRVRKDLTETGNSAGSSFLGPLTRQVKNGTDLLKSGTVIFNVFIIFVEKYLF